MSQVSLLIKPASSLCNLRCKYCFYEDVSQNREIESMGIMKEEVMKSLIDNTMTLPVDTIHYCFQGGEPTVAGIEYFYHFIQYVNEKNVSHKQIQYSIQTNGTLLNDRWIKLFKENRFLVGVSIDGYSKNHDYFRKDGKGNGTYKKILYNLRSLKNAGVSYNILTVLTKDLSRKPERLFEFYKENNFEYVQLIPCLPSLKHDQATDIFALQPKDFTTFYKRFFDLWYEEVRKGNYISVTLFDNVIPMYKGVLPSQCGMLGKCAMQIVVESNGNVYPCDFYVLDEYCCGNVCTDSLKDMVHNAIVKRFLEEPRKMCKQCDTCEFVHMCHGNCKRLGECYYDEEYCCYKEFLEYSKERMYLLSRMM